jgi:hypothetical protein
MTARDKRLQNNNFLENISEKAIYPIRIYTSGICRRGREYLLLRISKSYDICPWDWEWLTCSLNLDPKKSVHPQLISNVMQSLTHYTYLQGKVIKIFSPHIWNDGEFKLTYILFPVLIEVNDSPIELRGKFADYRWLPIDKIRDYDRNNYLYDFLVHLYKEDGEKYVFR